MELRFKLRVVLFQNMCVYIIPHQPSKDGKPEWFQLLNGTLKKKNSGMHKTIVFLCFQTLWARNLGKTSDFWYLAWGDSRKASSGLLHGSYTCDLSCGLGSSHLGSRVRWRIILRERVRVSVPGESRSSCLAF